MQADNRNLGRENYFGLIFRAFTYTSILKYCLPEIPEGYEVFQTVSNPYIESISYINEKRQTISFGQWVKSEAGPFHLNTEKGEIEEVEINGHYGLLLDVSDEKNNYSGVLWDNGDYILKLSGNLPKDELLNLAKSVKV